MVGAHRPRMAGEVSAIGVAVSRLDASGSGHIKVAMEHLTQEIARYELALEKHLEALRPALRPGGPTEEMLSDIKNPSSRSAIAETLDGLSGRMARCTEELCRATDLIDI